MNWMLRRGWVAVGCGALALAACMVTAGAQQFALKDGDTVVFYGDSITAQRFYTKEVEEFVLTRYPKLHVRFVNAGVPGDRVDGGYAGTMAQRVERDVAPYHPTVITVMLGMNDGGWGYGPADVDTVFQKGYRTLIETLRKAAPDAEITLLCPTPYDEITHGTEFSGYSRVIDKFAEDVAGIGAQLQASGDKGIAVVDLNHPMTGALERAKAQFPELAPLIVPDRIHPSETGHWIMTAALMKAWHVDPVVSRVTLNAANGAVIDVNRAAVTKAEKFAGGLRWTQIDEALPLPLDFNNAMTPMLLKISDLAQLDQMNLRVASLEPGEYELLIDGKRIANFSRDELEHGVNLALMKTPMLDEARDIDSQEDERMVLDHARFILSADVKPDPGSNTAEEQLSQAEGEMAATIRKDLDLKPHQFELRRK
jgi:lysophospholipase L1-like esterase